MLAREVGKVTGNAEVVVLGDLNVNLESPKDARQAAIVEEISSLGLRDVSKDFRSRSRGRGHDPFWFTWRTFREGRPISAKLDYVLSGRWVRWRWF